MADIDDSTKWFEADASNTQAPPNGWPAGMLPNQVEPTAQAMMGAIKRFWNRINGIYTSTGAAGVYAVTPAASYPASYVDGETFTFKAHQASRGAGAGGDTLNWNGLGAKKLYKPTTVGLAQIDANDIITGQRVETVYDATLDSSAGGFAMMTPPTASLSAPTGSGTMWFTDTAPTGWLICDGSSLLRSSYAALFAVIGTTYGAADGSHFSLPDLRGRVPAGFDSGNATGRLSGSGGVSAAALGNAGGAQTVTLGVGEMPAHSHDVNDPTHAHGPGSPGDAFIESFGGGATGLQVGGPINIAGVGATAAAGTGISIQSTGGGGAHVNVQPTLVLNFIIKT